MRTVAPRGPAGGGSAGRSPPRAEPDTDVSPRSGQLDGASPDRGDQGDVLGDPTGDLVARSPGTDVRKHGGRGDVLDDGHAWCAVT